MTKCTLLLDFVLTYDTESEQSKIFPHNPVFHDNFLITFEFALLDYAASKKKFLYSRYLLENAVPKLIELFCPIPNASTMEGSYLNFTPTQPDYLVGRGIILRCTKCSLPSAHRQFVNSPPLCRPKMFMLMLMHLADAFIQSDLQMRI